MEVVLLSICKELNRSRDDERWRDSPEEALPVCQANVNAGAAKS